jgi:hypothetical protein
MNRTTFSLIALLLVVVPAAGAAQNLRAPAAFTDKAAGAISSGPPTYCNPCLFYGGDFDSGSSMADAFWDGFNLISPYYAAEWVPFAVPKGEYWEVTKLFANISTNDGGILDPTNAEWYINQGMSTGHAGTIVGMGVNAATVSPTGRTVFGLPEYTVSVGIPRGIVLSPGEYWLSVAPFCTNTGDPACTRAVFYLSNTDGLNHYGHTEPAGQAFFSDDEGYVWTPLCDVGFNHVGCGWLSVGAVGNVYPPR